MSDENLFPNMYLYVGSILQYAFNSNFQDIFTRDRTIEVFFHMNEINL